LQANIGRVKSVREKTAQMKNEVKLLRKQLNKCYEDGVLVSLQESLNFIQNQSSGFEMIKSQFIDGVPVVSSGWD
jgi:hypothetical protein